MPYFFLGHQPPVSILTGPEGPVQPSSRPPPACASPPFQSSPVPKDRCNPASCARKPRLVVSILTGPEGPVQPSAFPSHVHVTEVSILTGPEGPVQLAALAQSPTHLPRFQSSPVPKDPCNRRVWRGGDQGRGFNPHRSRRTGATQAHTPLEQHRRVSILTGPEGPVQPKDTPPSNSAIAFQSSPVPKDRCNLPAAVSGGRPRSFNPHRSRRTGATTRDTPPRNNAVAVSILTGPEGPVQRRYVGHGRRAIEVSILTGPEGPVQLPAAVSGGVAARFQSSPVPKDRCNGLCTGGVGRWMCFNPHRSRRTGATLHLTAEYRACGKCFNPHRSRRTGATDDGRVLARQSGGFNPHRSRRTGATSSGQPRRSRWARFNPHRSRRTGATRAGGGGARPQPQFQSSPVPKDRCNLECGRLAGSAFPSVSILTGPEGPVQRIRP